MRKKQLVLSLLSGISLASISFAQDSVIGSAAVSSPKIKYDTNYIKSYADKLIIGLWQSGRSYNIEMTQKLGPDSAGISKVNYVANANNVTGFSLDYDIVSFSLGIKAISQGNDKVGNTDYIDLGLNFHAAGFRFENSFKQYQGFYDKNSPRYLDSSLYYKNPSMGVRMVKSKLIYAFNKKKFKLGAVYANQFRQLKTAGSWLLLMNFYANQMWADSSFVPTPHRQYYGIIWDGLNKTNVYGYSMGAGYSFTWVIFKKISLNGLAGICREKQYRHFYVAPENYKMSNWDNWWAFDLRTSIGYNGKRFFMRATAIFDVNSFKTSMFAMNHTFYAGSFDFGWRFNFKPPKPYRWFQSTKIYSWF